MARFKVGYTKTAVPNHLLSPSNVITKQSSKQKNLPYSQNMPTRNIMQETKIVTIVNVFTKIYKSYDDLPENSDIDETDLNFE